MNKFEKISYEQYFADSNNSKEIYDQIKIPTRATKYSAGYDFYTPQTISLAPGGYVIVKTGIKCSLDKDKVLLLAPRSGLGFKYKLHLANTIGVIDSDYYNNAKNEGHILIKICNGGKDIVKINAGEAFAQGIITQFFIAEEEEITAERKGGIGSTSAEDELPINLAVERPE